MRAMIVTGTGLELRDVPMPQHGPDEVLIRVHAAGLNRAELAMLACEKRSIRMSSYVVATMTIHDLETYRRYTALTPALVARHGGRFLTRGDDVLTAEGAPFTERMVILEFPSTAAVQAWLSDPDYVAAARFRQMASNSRILIKEGRPNSGDPDPRV